MLRAMMEQDDGARMVDNVGLEQLDGNHWRKRPESRDKKCLSSPGQWFFGDFGLHLQASLGDYNEIIYPQ